MLGEMVILALLAASVAQPAATPDRPLVKQATATVRILEGTRVEARNIPKDALVRKVRVESADGSGTTARLVEFP